MTKRFNVVSCFFILFILISFFSLTLVPSKVSAAEEEEIKITIKDGKFDPQEVKVKSGKKIKLIVTNSDKSAAEFESVDLDREKVVRPGQSITILLSKLEPGTYEFFDHFHPNTPHGKIIVE
ncbi:MAG TPA: cupredoxin domain-containing protein [Nitrospiria bacterium]|nr:cupredoxin domain-containing protein [Nitrospiria bacterium]